MDEGYFGRSVGKYFFVLDLIMINIGDIVLKNKVI